MHLATVYFVLGWQTELDTLLESAESEISSNSPFLLPNFLAFTARRHILEGDRNAATAWLNNYFVAAGSEAVIKIPFYRIFQYFTTARAHILLGHYQLAESTILGLLELSTNFVRPMDITEAKTLLAALYWLTERKEEAIALMETALLAMQPYGFIRTIASEGKAIAPVLKRILAKVEQPGYRGELDQVYVNSVYLCAYSVGQSRAGIVKGSAPKSLRLSRQQKLVLNLLAAGYKREDIVEKTGLSLNTVKSHLRLLYQKLDASSAAEAVSRAHELHLVD
jgi:LuxR family maltose regulon positive regulatory protein